MSHSPVPSTVRSGAVGEGPLDDPVSASLQHAHAPFADRLGSALRYQPDVAPFSALPGSPFIGLDAERTWRDLAALVGPGGMTTVTGPAATQALAPPEGWEVVAHVPGVQMVDDGVAAVPDAEAVELGAADVPAVLDLVERTRPGPFGPRTIELGRYLGIRRGDTLVAMAGERMHPPGWTEISAVCTDPVHRGHGLATRLVRAVAHGIRQRGEIPFLHAAAGNTPAVRLYESLGFRMRAEPAFVGLRTARRTSVH